MISKIYVSFRSVVSGSAKMNWTVELWINQPILQL